MVCLVGLALSAALAGCPAGGGGAGVDAGPPVLSNIIQRRGRAITVPVWGAEWVRANDHVDLISVQEDPQTREGMALTIAQNYVVLDLGPLPPQAADRPSPRQMTLLALPEEAEIVLLASRTGKLWATVRHPEDLDIMEERGRATMATVLTGERINRLLQKRRALWPEAGEERR
jgi:pilus assembly protein CpaB